MSTLCNPLDCGPSVPSAHGIFQTRILGGLPFSLPGDLPDPGIQPAYSALQANSLPAEALGKPIKEPIRIKFPLFKHLQEEPKLQES